MKFMDSLEFDIFYVIVSSTVCTHASQVPYNGLGYVANRNRIIGGLLVRGIRIFCLRAIRFRNEVVPDTRRVCSRGAGDRQGNIARCELICLPGEVGSIRSICVVCRHLHTTNMLRRRFLLERIFRRCDRRRSS